VGSAMGIGKIGGPAIGGILGSISISLPFYITAALILISAIAVYLFLPESLDTKKKGQLSIRNFSITSSFKTVFRVQRLTFLLVSGVLFYAGLAIFQFNITVFLKDIYQWTPARIGSILTLIGICDILVRAVLLPRLLHYYSEKTIAILGLSILAMGFALLLVSVYTQYVALIICAIIFIISGDGL